MSELFHPGLRGVIAGETEICRIDGGVQYRGYCLDELTQGATFLEVAYLLLFDEFPSQDHYADLVGVIAEEQQLPPIITQVYDQIPMHASPLEVLRTGLGLLSLFDDQNHENLLFSGHSQTIRMLARVPLLLAAWQSHCQGTPLRQPLPELSYIANLYYLVTGRAPSALYERALDIALLTAMEHEFNPSSYVARIVGSVRASQYGPVLAALDTFIGQSHGGGDDRPLDVLQQVGEPQHAEDWVESLDSTDTIPGFGHPVHQECDPRASIIEAECARLAQACGRKDLEDLAEAIELAVWKHRKLPPNLDWPLARLLSYLEIDRDLFRPIFACARLVGWSCHALEQCESNEVIRPRARYRGAKDCHFESNRLREA